MGTKNNPGKYDCYAKAEPDEPMFVLLGRDPLAATLVRAWARRYEGNGQEPKKIDEARACADALEIWANSLGNSGPAPSLMTQAEETRLRNAEIDCKTLRETVSNLERNLVTVREERHTLLEANQRATDQRDHLRVALDQAVTDQKELLTNYEKLQAHLPEAFLAFLKESPQSLDFGGDVADLLGRLYAGGQWRK
jgi:hypothetical protein